MDPLKQLQAGVSGFWTPSLTETDPQVPYLPLETAAAGGIADDDGGFWNFGAQIAVAAVLAANIFTSGLSNAAANSHNDEMVAAPPTVALDAGDWVVPQPAAVPPVTRLWPHSDELPRAGNSVAEPSYWILYRPQQTSVLVYTGEEEVFPVFAPPALDAGDWRPVQPQSVQPTLRVWLGEDERPTLVPHEEEAYQVPLVAKTEPKLQTWHAADERPTPQAQLHEEAWRAQQPEPQRSTLRVWLGEDERPALCLDDYYQVDLRSYVLPPVLRLWLGSDDRTAVVTHSTSGVLVGHGAQLRGDAALPAEVIGGFDDTYTPRTRRIVHHVASGVLVGKGAEVKGSARITRTSQNPLALLLTSV